MELQRLDELALRPSAPKTNPKSWIPQVPKVWSLRQLIGLSAPKHEPSSPSSRSIAIPEPLVTSPQSESGHVQVTAPPVINSTPTLQSPSTRESPGCNVDATSERTVTGRGTLSRTSTSHNSLASATSIEDNECSTTTSSQSTTLPTPSTSLSITVGPRIQIIKIDKGVFASPKHEMEECHLQAWSIIRSRLDDTLRHTFKPIAGLDATMSLEFMMAGPSPSQLKPSIIMVCCNEPHRRQLKKILKTQKWIASYNYHCIVLVDPLQQLMDGVNDFLEQEETVWLVEAMLPIVSASLCGVQARAKGTIQGETSMVTFTIGGVLAIQGQNFAMTAGHVFHSFNAGLAPRLVVPDIYTGLGDSEGSEDDQDEDSESESPFVIFDDDASPRGSVTSTDFSTPESSMSHDPVSFAPTPSIEDLAHCHVGEERGCQEAELWTTIGVILTNSANRQGYMMDWALIGLYEPDRWTSNTLPVSNQGFESSLAVKSLAEGSNFGAEAVWIHGGVSGRVRAWSSNCPAQLYGLGSNPKESTEVYQVITDSPLSPGDSGAWVVQDDGTLRGHIIARRTGAVHLAYLVPILPIIEDIKARWHVSAVQLPVIKPGPSGASDWTVAITRELPTIWKPIPKPHEDPWHTSLHLPYRQDETIKDMERGVELHIAVEHPETQTSDLTSPLGLPHRTHSDLSRFVESSRRKPIPYWKPESMRISHLTILLIMPLFMMLGLVGMELIPFANRPATQPGPDDTSPEPKTADEDWIYVTILVGNFVWFGSLWRRLEVDIARLEPYYQMFSNGSGAAADMSIHLDYQARSPFSRCLIAFGNRHYIVAVSSLCSIVFTYVLPILSMGTVDYILAKPGEPGGLPKTVNLTLAIMLVIFYPVVCTVLYSVRKREYGLTGDVAAISDLVFIVEKHVLADFKDLDTAVNSDIRRSLRGRYEVSLGRVSRREEHGPLGRHDEAVRGWLRSLISSSDDPHPYPLRSSGLVHMFVCILVLGVSVAGSLWLRLPSAPRRIMDLMVAFWTCATWARLESAARMIEPYFILSQGNAPSRTLNLEYSAVSTWNALVQSLYNRHFVLASVLIGTALSRILPVLVLLLDKLAEPTGEAGTSFWLLAGAVWGVLVYMAGAVIVLFSTRRRRFLPRVPDTIASALAFIHRSKMTSEFSRKSSMNWAQRKDFVAELKKQYGFGWFHGHDGDIHLGIDEEPLISGFSLGYDYSRQLLGYRAVDQVDWL